MPDQLDKLIALGEKSWHDLTTTDRVAFFESLPALFGAAKRLKRIGEILGPKLKRDIPYLSSKTQSAVVLTMDESRELSELLK